jgi:hypothetical protein
MSLNHETTGWEKFDAELRTIRKMGVLYVLEELDDESMGMLYRGLDIYGRRQNLRKLRYWDDDYRGDQPNLVEYVVEEYLSVDDGESDGCSQVDIVKYRAGKRPRMFRYVYDWGRLHYPDIPVQDFIYSITDSAWIEMSSRWDDDDWVK